jgi:Family of unknown function (DUF6062)
MSQEVHWISRTRDAASLRTAFGREGCPVCTVVLEEMAMARWNYKGFSDVAHRHELIRSRGFCPLHTWQLAERPNAFQLGLVYREILTDLLASWEQQVQHLSKEYGTSHPISSSPGQSPGKKTWWQRLVSAFWPSVLTIDPASFYARCPFCRTRTRTEQRVTQTLVTLFAFEETQALFCQSTGLCRLHVEQALRFAQQQPEARRKALLACQRVCLQRTLEEVREQVRKHDYRFANEPRGDEMTAWRRAAELCAGNRGVY